MILWLLWLVWSTLRKVSTLLAIIGVIQVVTYATLDASSVPNQKVDFVKLTYDAVAKTINWTVNTVPRLLPSTERVMATVVNKVSSAGAGLLMDAVQPVVPNTVYSSNGNITIKATDKFTNMAKESDDLTDLVIDPENDMYI